MKQQGKKAVVVGASSGIGREVAKILMEQEVNTILEWNAGNHFVDSEKRMAKGFAWLLNNQK